MKTICPTVIITMALWQPIHLYGCTLHMKKECSKSKAKSVMSVFISDPRRIKSSNFAKARWD